MNRIAKELDEKLQKLAPEKARSLEILVREAMDQVESDDNTNGTDWPTGYFEKSAGALAGERFVRPDQGEFPSREDW